MHWKDTLILDIGAVVLIGCATPIVYTQPTPDPGQFYRVGPTFFIAPTKRTQGDTVQLYEDNGTCQPERAYLLWPKAPDTLSVATFAPQDSIAIIGELPANSPSVNGNMTLLNTLEISLPKDLAKELIAVASAYCKKVDPDYVREHQTQSPIL